MHTHEHWLSLVDTFQSAALGEKPWDVALQGFADATGSRGSQLIGRRSDLSVLFNVMTSFDPDVQKSVIELQPLNPRPPVLEQAPLLQAIADRDVISAEEAKHDPFYQEVLRPADAPFFCATVIERQQDTFVTLGVMRSHAEGYITSEQRQTFLRLAPHVRAAVHLQSALGGRAVASLAESMESLSIPLLICDSSARVSVLTQSAEALAASGRGLQLKGGRLGAALERENRALREAVAAAAPTHCTAGPPLPRTVVIHGSPSVTASPVVLEVFPLASRVGTMAFTSIAPRVAVVACGERRGESRRAAILGAVYRLTAAEIEIALLLAAGKSTADIAAHRNVSAGTVRLQIKAVMGKIGARRRVELAVRLNQL